ncbi:MAG: hypothetical protein GXO29_00030 [Thermotogae bacterium]|nr:hypothetical protein [Thermotogota bacterium]
MWIPKGMEAKERRLRELLDVGRIPRNLLKEVILFHFFDMNLAKVKEYLQYYGHVLSDDRVIRWLKFMVRFLELQPLPEPDDPVQAFYYHLYYEGRPSKAYGVLESNREALARMVSPEFFHALYIQALSMMGRMYVIPEDIKLNLPMDVYLSINRIFTADALAPRRILSGKNLPFFVSNPMAKRLAIVGKIFTSLMERDFLTYDLLMRIFKDNSERYLHLTGRILGGIFDPSLSPDDDEIPPYVPFLRTVNDWIRGRKECRKIIPEMAGVQGLLWHMFKVRDEETYISYGGKLRIIRGREEIKVPRRKALIILGILRSAGSETLREMARYVFPKSPHPMKTVYDYMRYIREFRYAPSNLKFALFSGSFLHDETETWALILKDKLRREGRLKPPVIARP